MKLGLLHTVKSGYLLYEPQIKARIPNISIYTILDDFLSKESGEKGYATTLCRNKVLTDCRMMEECGVDVVLCACSSMSPVIPDVRKYLKIPLISVDELMIQTIVEKEQDILIFATAYSAGNAVSRAIEEKASEMLKAIHIDVLVCNAAGEIVRKGGAMDEHDRLAMECFDQNFVTKKTVVFAQSSNAHLGRLIAEKYHVRTYTNLEYCITDLEQTIERLESAQK